MMGKIGFTEQAWENYLYWQVQDRRQIKKINELLKDISRNGSLKGIGKPERLRGNLSEFYSRRIDEKNRLVYSLSALNEIEVQQCKGHYDNRD